MAIIDQERGVIVVRIIYDGPPFSGKTTSVQALSTILGKTSKLFSPEESSGRTLYFDWMEYVGGYFRGYSISCQIVSVPGQLSLQDRRHFLLNSADVVVFVIDSSKEESHIALSYFKDMQPFLVRSDEAVRVIIQANKQDKDHVLTAEQLTDLFRDYPSTKIVESTATLGKGVRETFVLAVRLAIERASALISKGQLPLGKPEINSGEELFALLQRVTVDSSAITGTEKVEPSVDKREQLNELFAEEPLEFEEIELSADHEVDELAQLNELFTEEVVAVEIKKPLKQVKQGLKPLPKLPDEDISVHWIWPPFAGQKMLEELFKHALRPRLREDGTWLIEVQDKWRCFSKQYWCYSSSEQARQALRLQISRHLRCNFILSEQRCIAVTAESEDSWRLWQILSTGTTLLTELTQALHRDHPIEIALQLHKSATDFSKAYQDGHRCPFMTELTLDSFGLNEQKQLIYLGSIDDVRTDRESLAMVLKEAFAIPVKEILATVIEKQVLVDELKKIEQKPSIVTETLIELLNQ